jgi:hypothetical protein
MFDVTRSHIHIIPVERGYKAQLFEGINLVDHSNQRELHYENSHDLANFLRENYPNHRVIHVLDTISDS